MDITLLSYATSVGGRGRAASQLGRKLMSLRAQAWGRAPGCWCVGEEGSLWSPTRQPRHQPGLGQCNRLGLPPATGRGPRWNSAAGGLGFCRPYVFEERVVVFMLPLSPEGSTQPEHGEKRWLRELGAIAPSRPRSRGAGLRTVLQLAEGTSLPPAQHHCCPEA